MGGGGLRVRFEGLDVGFDGPLVGVGNEEAL